MKHCTFHGFIIAIIKRVSIHSQFIYIYANRSKCFDTLLQVQTNDNINWAHLSTHPLFGPSSIKWKWKAQDMLITWKCIYRLYGVTHDEYHSRLYYLIRPKLFCCFDIQTCIHMHTNMHTNMHTYTRRSVQNIHERPP